MSAELKLAKELAKALGYDTPAAAKKAMGSAFDDAVNQQVRASKLKPELIPHESPAIDVDEMGKMQLEADDAVQKFKDAELKEKIIRQETEPKPETGLARIPGRNYDSPQVIELLDKMPRRSDAGTPNPAAAGKFASSFGQQEELAKRVLSAQERAKLDEEAAALKQKLDKENELKAALERGKQQLEQQKRRSTGTKVAAGAALTAGTGAVIANQMRSPDEVLLAETVQEMEQRGQENREAEFGKMPTRTVVTPADAGRAEDAGTSTDYQELMNTAAQLIGLPRDDSKAPPVLQKLSFVHLPEEERAPYEQKLNELKAGRLEAIQDWKARKQQLGWREVIEKLGQAISLFAVAEYGTKHGVDAVSGLKFNPTDWNEQYRLAYQEFRDQLQDFRSQEQDTEKQMEERRSAFQSAADKNVQAQNEVVVRDWLERKRDLDNAKERTLRLAMDMADSELREEQNALRQGKVGPRTARAMERAKASLEKENKKRADALKQVQADLLDVTSGKQKYHNAANRLNSNMIKAGMTMDFIEQVKIQGEGGLFVTKKDQAEKMLNYIRANIKELEKPVQLDPSSILGVQAPAQPQQQASAMVQVQMPDGNVGEIPADQLEAFLSKFPGSKVIQ